MPEVQYEVDFYRDKNGKSQVEDWLNDLDAKKGKKTELTQYYTKIKLLKTMGTRAPRDSVEYLRDGIYEIRPGDNRVLFAGASGPLFILLHQYRKKSQKCPDSQIEQAKREWKDWCERNDHK